MNPPVGNGSSSKGDAPSRSSSKDADFAAEDPTPGDSHGETIGHAHAAPESARPRDEGPSSEHPSGYGGGTTLAGAGAPGDRSDSDREPSLPEALSASLNEDSGYVSAFDLESLESEPTAVSSEMTVDGMAFGTSASGEFGLSHASGLLTHGGRTGDELSGLEIDDQVKTVIPERVGGYVVGPPIGRGGMGEVYLAEHASMGRQVALKVLPARWLNRESLVKRFYEEVRTASRLLHPNIVTAFDAGQSGDIHYLAMEFVDGKTLSQIIASDGPMTVGDAASAVRQAALALQHAHSAGVVHRDVKPGNLMRASDGTIKLLDLGLAQIDPRLSQRLAQSRAERKRDLDPNAEAEIRSGRTLVGTLSFISPEQLEDPKSADARSDQYSLGATLFYLLAGRPPFLGEMIDQVYGHRHGTVPDLMSIREDVDISLQHIVQRMLAKDPDQRYGSIDEVARAMSRYANDRSTPAWVRDFTQQIGTDETSAHTSNDSTRQSDLRVMGLELGMTHAATVVGDGGESWHAGRPGRRDGKPHGLFRLAIGQAKPKRGQPPRLLFDETAYALRSVQPMQVSHCQLMYAGRDDMFRQLGDRACSPEVALAMCLRHLMGNTMRDYHRNLQRLGAIGDEPNDPIGVARTRGPDATAITVPGCYDQLHRSSILQAARLAGLNSVRLIDRSIAVYHAALDAKAEPTLDHGSGLDATIPLDPGPVDSSHAQSKTLFIALTSQALDVAVMSHRERQIRQLGVAGHWSLGSLAWSSRLVELIASHIPNAPSRTKNNRPTQSELVHATKIQMAGERAQNALLLLPETHVEIEHEGRVDRIGVRRDDWLAACDGLIDAIRDAIEQALEQAKTTLDQIDQCFLIGPILKLPILQQVLLGDLNDQCLIESFDRADAARGAALALATELPGIRSGQLPARKIASQSIGFVVNDRHGRRRILPIIPRGTAVPARANRQLRGVSGEPEMKLSLVESTGRAAHPWQTLGRHLIEMGDEDSYPSRQLGFEVDINGILSVHCERPDLGRTVVLPPLPATESLTMDAAPWTGWIEATVR
ncbi:MAG: protein kinase [Planctomycetota bacterium]